MAESTNKDQIKPICKKGHDIENISKSKPTANAVSKGSVKARGRILVMDEEEAIRNLSEMQLTRLGYNSKICADGAAAIEAYKNGMRSEDPFDVVILDLTHETGMGAVETIKELLKIDPTVKGIVSTGYLYDPAAVNFKTYGFCGVLLKPYTKVELQSILSGLIDEDQYI